MVGELKAGIETIATGLAKATETINTEPIKKTDFEVIEDCRTDSETGATFIKLLNGDYSDYQTKQEAFTELCRLISIKTEDFTQIKVIAQRSSLFEIADAPQEKKVALSFSGADEAGFAIRTLAKEFIESYSPVVSMGGCLYVYKDGVYETNELAMSKARIFIEDELAWNKHMVGISTRNADNVLRMVCDRVAITSKEINRNPERLVVRNGILDVKTGILYKHTFREIHTIKVDIEYNPEIGVTETFKNYLDTTFEGVENEKDVAQELFGYCLYKGYFIEKFFFLIGDGNNGKSVFINLITKLLGETNVTSMTLHDICSPRDQFSLIGLYGKMANLCGETGTDKIKNLGSLKRATGRDMIRSRALRQDWVEFSNFAKHIFSMNNPPEIEDGTKGAKRRMEYIDFPNTFDKEKADKQLEEKLMTDISLTGILNWAIAGLKRLFENNEFTEVRDEAHTALEYEKKSNPIAEFVKEHVDESAKGVVNEENLFEAYVYFATLYKLPSLKKKDIKQGLIDECKEIGIEVKCGQSNGKDRKRFYKGIVLVNTEKLKPSSINSKDDREQEPKQEKKKVERKVDPSNTQIAQYDKEEEYKGDQVTDDEGMNKFLEEECGDCEEDVDKIAEDW